MMTASFESVYYMTFFHKLVSNHFRSWRKSFLLTEPHISFHTSNFYFLFISIQWVHLRLQISFRGMLLGREIPFGCGEGREGCRTTVTYIFVVSLNIGSLTAVTFAVNCRHINVFFSLWRFSLLPRSAVLKPNFNLTLWQGQFITQSSDVIVC